MPTTARPFVTALILLLGVALACNYGGLARDGQSTPGETPAASTQAPAPAEPTQALAATATTAPPTAQPAPTAASNVGENGAPIFAAGGWTGGEAEVRVTGNDTRTITGTLSTESSTEGGTTRLIYTADIDTIFISISTEYEPFDMGASQEDFSIRIPFGQPPCEVTYVETSDTRIEGTFLCEHAEIEFGPHAGPAVMEGSFTATR